MNLNSAALRTKNSPTGLKYRSGRLYWGFICTKLLLVFAQDKTGHSKNEQTILDEKQEWQLFSVYLPPFFFFSKNHVIKGFLKPQSERDTARPHRITINSSCQQCFLFSSSSCAKCHIPLTVLEKEFTREAAFTAQGESSIWVMTLSERTSSSSHPPAGQNVERHVELVWRSTAPCSRPGCWFKRCAGPLSSQHALALYIDWLTVGKCISGSLHSPVLMLTSLLLWQSCGVNLFSCQVSFTVFRAAPIDQSLSLR